MSYVNLREKNIQLKIVYYGPGRGGKTTNLEYIYKKYKEHIQSDLVSLNTYEDRTIFFDFLPLNMGKIDDFDVKISIYTVPGQVKYNSTRKLVLKGADGVVFVADSQRENRQKNILSLDQLHENLQSYNESIFHVPLVLQYNKMDLRAQGVDIMPTELLEQDLNSKLKVPSFEASAKTGHGVIDTLKKIISTTMVTIQKRIS